MKILFFSRGRGYGHAIPDMAIAEEIIRLAPNSKILFASYGTGFVILKDSKWAALDLGLEERNRFCDALLASSRLIERASPDLVVCHEEFAAVMAAKVHRKPSIFASAWLPRDASIQAEAVSSADQIIIFGHPGLFARPAHSSAIIHNVGPVVRRMKYSRSDRESLRTSMQIPENGLLIVVVAGGWSTEDRVPIADLVLGAYALLSNPSKRLVWLAGSDRARLADKTALLPGVEILDFLDPIDRLTAAADVVITKGTYGITCECSALGLPSIALSNGANPMDDFLSPRIRGTTWLNAMALSAQLLSAEIETCCNRTLVAPAFYNGAELSAKIILNSDVLNLSKRAP